MSTPKKVATTVKVDPTLYDEFKVLGVRYKLTLQGLIEKTVYRYVKEEVFRNDINGFHVPVDLSSSFSASASASSSLA